MARRGIKPVYLDTQSIRALITSAIEVYNRETNGVLIGWNTRKKINGRMRKVLSIRDVYPYQTDIRTPSQVMHGNIAAFKRVIGSLASMKMKVVGGYHSHCWPFEVIRLSKSDVDFSKDEMEYINNHRKNPLKEWVEILLTVKKKEYKSPHEIGWFLTEQRNGIKSLTVMNAFEGYDIVITAYWVERHKRRKVTEAKVYTPWLL